VFGFPALAGDFQVMAPAARTVDDAYLLFRAMAGPDNRDLSSLAFADYPLPVDLAGIRLPRARIRCVLGVGDAPVDARVRASVQAAARTLASLGHVVEEGAAPYDLAEVEQVWSTLSSAGLARVVISHSAWQDSVHPSSRAIVERGMGVSTAQYIEALDAVQALRSRIPKCFDTTDFLLTPTSASLPWPVGQPYPEHIDGRAAGPRGAALFATFVNAAALPAVSIPVEPAPDGLPIGMQLVARFGGDVALLRLAREFEEAAPWSFRSSAPA
jgi:aspartyl-tRNA(Asn)/glutamyl-tRNA(Gln) amidotransferase subunit A